MSHFVYIIKCENFLKVGITRDLKSRLYGINQGMPLDCSLVYSINCFTREKAREIEKYTHEELCSMGFLHKGEWFKGCSVSQVVSVIDKNYKSVRVYLEKRKMEIINRSFSSHSKLKTQSKKESEIKEKIRLNNIYKDENILNKIASYKRSVISERTGVCSKKLYRQIYKGVELCKEDIDKIRDFFIKNAY